jgi:hypothetical protein
MDSINDQTQPVVMLGYRWLLLQGLHWYTVWLMMMRERVVSPLQSILPAYYSIWVWNYYCWWWGIRQEPDDFPYMHGWYCYAHVEQRISPQAKHATLDVAATATEGTCPMVLSLQEAYEPAVCERREVLGDNQIDPLLIIRRVTTPPATLHIPTGGSEYETVYYLRRRCAKSMVLSALDDSSDDSEPDMPYRPISLPNPVVWSNVRFLCIEYRHPKMSEAVELTLPVAMMVVGNELLSPTCVLRLLEHTMRKRSYHFDFNYQLSIMDSRIRMFTMQSHQYLVLHKDTYVVDMGPSMPGTRT